MTCTAPHLRLVEPDPDLARVLARPPLPPRPIAWTDLHFHNGQGCRDPRGMAAILVKLGLHVHALHGVDEHGRCTCGEPACGKATGKHPIRAGWQREPLDLAAVDHELLKNWRLNLGIRTGRQPCGRFLVVVDVDGPRDLLDPLEREHGAFPPTLTARTGSGGLHLYFWLRDGIEMGNRVRVVPHVDVRGAAGQVVAPPSRHRSGGYYEWIDVREPEVLP